MVDSSASDKVGGGNGNAKLEDSEDRAPTHSKKKVKTHSKGKAKDAAPLVVTSWSVTITTVPEPDSIGLWGMAGLLGGLGVAAPVLGHELVGHLVERPEPRLDVLVHE